MKLDELFCQHHCRHGGHCTLDPGHDGLHDASGRCQWSDEESVSRVEADAIFLASGNPMASLIVTMGELVEGMIEALEMEESP